VSRLLALTLAAALGAGAAHAQSHDHGQGPASDAAPFGPPIADTASFSHLMIDQLEGRLSVGDGSAHWSAEAWTGADASRLWLKSEGDVRAGRVGEGRFEALYDRPLASFWDLQAGVRADLDSGPGRVWAAFGVEGLAPYFVKLAATGYVGERGRLAMRLEGSTDLRFTQRLILEPRLEANLYSRDDAARRTGSGLSDLGAGLRLRYEITRKLAPYFGIEWSGRFGEANRYARAAGEAPNGATAVVGLRSWF